ncbi:efflux RND transporter permease subunit [Sutcliffiella horikoshii]|uniref:efflux RND transporter permease subunit n=1 Tax=Sutcliffiella horikoshii TaxID=79883 RepID=UPI00203E42CB|nr:efflux RND transporter permease subunit [Sutcliffiella horikoshii]MCM3616113.1 efflux RND transporter permease subunit [Sutcliffiella horikoshii]
MSMMENILKRKIAVGLMVIFVFMIGLYSLSKLDQELMPPISFDMTIVQIDAGEMPVLDVEEKITKPIEQILSGMEGVDSHSSASYTGKASITVTIEEGRGDEIHKNIESAIAPLSNQIPGIQYINSFQVTTSQDYEFYMDISNGNMEKITAFAKNVVEPRLEALPAVRDVKFDGLEKNEILIHFKDDVLAEYGVDSQQIIQTIQQSNLITSFGKLSEETNGPTLRWNTSLMNLEDLEEILVPTMAGVKELQELADITLQVRDTASGVWKDGSRDVVMVQIGRVSDVTQIEMAEAVRAEVDKIKEEGLVEAFTFEEIVTQADYVSDAVDGVSSNILIGGLLAIVVLFLFLRNVRATIIIGISIPISILLTFASMWILGYSINMLSLIALGLGIGMMVDASIVILESIYRKKEQGIKSREAVLAGVKEVASAVFASMLTTIVVFLPIGLLGGEAGKFMIILSVVVIVTLVSSVIVSFTLIPSLSENFLRLSKRQKQKKNSRIILSYGRFIQWLTYKKRRRYGVIFLFILMFVASLALVTKVPMTIMPDMYNRYSEIMVSLDKGVTPAQKNDIAKAIHSKLEDIPDVKEGFVLDQIESMFVLINMTPEQDATLEQKEVNERILSELLDLTGEYPIMDVTSVMSAGASYPVQIDISGEDLDVLTSLTAQVMSELKEVEGIIGSTTSLGTMMDEERIVLDETKMKEDGISPLQILGELNSLTSSIPIGALQDEAGTPIVIAPNGVFNKKADLLNLEVSTLNGAKKLSNYITFEQIKAPGQIDHTSGERVVKVLANIENRDLGSVNRDVQEVIDSFETPDRYNISVGGSLEQQQEALQDMLVILGIAIFLVYVVMAVQFNHLLHPLIVMTIIPMTFTGVILGLLLTQRELSIMSGMGVIMLIGIVLNNAILLIDRAKQLRDDDYGVGEAMVEAGMNRIRPIFMTTLTTVGGMLPLAISTGAASNYQAPLATVVIAGLLFSTLITLVLIPSVYMLFHDLGVGIRKVFKQSKKKGTEQVSTSKKAG